MQVIKQAVVEPFRFTLLPDGLEVHASGEFVGLIKKEDVNEFAMWLYHELAPKATVAEVIAETTHALPPARKTEQYDVSKLPSAEDLSKRSSNNREKVLNGGALQLDLPPMANSTGQAIHGEEIVDLGKFALQQKMMR